MAVPDNLDYTTDVYLDNLSNNGFRESAVFLEPCLPDTQYARNQVLIVKACFQGSGMDLIMITEE